MSIRENAALAYFSCGAWQGKRIDRRVAAEAAAQYGHKGTGKYYKSLLERGTGPILAARSAAYACHYELTSPWGARGQRIISTENVMVYMDRMREIREQFDDALEHMIKHLERLLEKEQEIWNGLFRIEDYPTVAQLRAKHYFLVELEPLTNVSDWRLDLAEEASVELQDAYTKLYNDRLAGAMIDTWGRLDKALVALTDRLGKKDGAGLRQSLIDSPIKIAGQLANLDVAGDSDIATVAKYVKEEFGKLDAALIRDDIDELIRASKITKAARAFVQEATAKYDMPEEVDDTVEPVPEVVQKEVPVADAADAIAEQMAAYV